MTDITNKNRAGWASHAVLAYAIGKEGKRKLYDKADLVLSDLLCDLHHYADMKGIDFKVCASRAASAYSEEIADELDNEFGLRCPECGRSAEIDIAATVWVRLCPDGTDVTASRNGDHEWANESAAQCCVCGHCGTVADFGVAS